MCERTKKTMRFFFSHERHIWRFIVVFDESQVSYKLKYYCNLFYNSELNWSLSYGLSLQGKMVFHVNIFVIVCNCFFGLIILVIILFGTLVVSLVWLWKKNEKMWKKTGAFRGGDIGKRNRWECHELRWFLEII